MNFQEFKNTLVVQHVSQSETLETFTCRVRSINQRDSALFMIWQQCVDYFGTENIVIFDVEIEASDPQMYGASISVLDGTARAQLDLGQFVAVSIERKQR